MLKEDHIPPLHWLLGRIQELHLGRDGVTRVVTRKTAKGIFKKPVHNICPLPMDEKQIQIGTMESNNQKE